MRQVSFSVFTVTPSRYCVSRAYRLVQDYFHRNATTENGVDEICRFSKNFRDAYNNYFFSSGHSRLNVWIDAFEYASLMTTVRKQLEELYQFSSKFALILSFWMHRKLTISSIWWPSITKFGQNYLLHDGYRQVSLDLLSRKAKPLMNQILIAYPILKTCANFSLGRPSSVGDIAKECPWVTNE